MRASIKQFLLRTGRWEAGLYRLFLMSTPSAYLNFVVQRIFRVNGKCKWCVHFTSRIISPENLRIDVSSSRSLAVSGGVYIQALNGVEIGKNVLIAPGVKIISSNHDILSDAGPVKADPIIIGDDSWLGANVVVLPGVCLGKRTVVGAGAVVTKSFSAGNIIIAGNPAKEIRKINGDI